MDTVDPNLVAARLPLLVSCMQFGDFAQIYVAKGFNKEEAAAVIGTLTRKREYHDYFVDHMMVQASWEGLSGSVGRGRRSAILKRAAGRALAGGWAR
jgi:hypothetical protein